MKLDAGAWMLLGAFTVYAIWYYSTHKNGRF